MRGIASRVAAAALLVAAAYAGIPAAPAAAATCSSADGVSVVVDFHQLGGGVQSACVPDGGGRLGTDLFAKAGFALTYVQRQPGFVCRVDGLPTAEQDACVTTPDASAYWSLWWTDGTSGKWTYSTSNVGGLRVPDGGYVAFSWNTGSRPVPPGAAPVVHPELKPEPETTTPTSKPSMRPSTSATPSATPSPTATESASASPSATDKPQKLPSKQASGTPSEAAAPSESPSPSASDEPLPTSAEPEPADDGLPGWVAPAVIGVLFAGAGVVAVLRRRRTPGGP